jgi:hypothetical protein
MVNFSWGITLVSAFSKVFGPLSRRFRRQRAEVLRDMVPEVTGGYVIDIGGSVPFWNLVMDQLKPEKVEVFNVTEGRMKYGLQARDGNVEYHLYDGKQVPREDMVADLVICSSVMEHVPLENRMQVAKEIRRLGKRYYVQVPAPEFPIEMHFILPLIHWVPRRLGRLMAPIAPWRFLVGVGSEHAKAYFDETRLLTKRELKALFPEAEIIVERFLGLPKSYMAFSR